MGTREANQILAIIVTGLVGMTVLSTIVGMVQCGAASVVGRSDGMSFEEQPVREVDLNEAERRAFERSLEKDLEAYRSGRTPEGAPMPPIQVDRVEHMPGADVPQADDVQGSLLVDSALVPGVLACGGAGLVFSFASVLSFLMLYRGRRREDDAPAVPEAPLVSNAAVPPPPPPVGRSVTPSTAVPRVEYEIGSSGATIPPSQRVKQAQERQAALSQVESAVEPLPPGAEQFDEYGRPPDYEGESHTGYYVKAGGTAVVGGCLLLLFLIGPVPLAFAIGLWLEG